MTNSEHRRKLATQVVARKGCSQHQVCRFFGMHRATYRYRPKRPRLARQQAVVVLSLEHAELGGDKIAAMARRDGHRISNRRED